MGGAGGWCSGGFDRDLTSNISHGLLFSLAPPRRDLDSRRNIITWPPTGPPTTRSPAHPPHTKTRESKGFTDAAISTDYRRILSLAILTYVSRSKPSQRANDISRSFDQGDAWQCRDSRRDAPADVAQWRHHCCHLAALLVAATFFSLLLRPSLGIFTYRFKISQCDNNKSELFMTIADDPISTI